MINHISVLEAAMKLEQNQSVANDTIKATDIILKILNDLFSWLFSAEIYSIAIAGCYTYMYNHHNMYMYLEACVCVCEGGGTRFESEWTFSCYAWLWSLYIVVHFFLLSVWLIYLEKKNSSRKFSYCPSLQLPDCTYLVALK